MTQTTITFRTDKNGKPFAMQWLRSNRWCRINLEEAKLLVATGQAREEKDPFIPSRFGR